jgi:Flp pilus assembly protein TadG
VTRRRAGKRSGSENAQALAEFGLIAPLVFLIIFGIVDMSRAMQSYVTVQEGARSAARYAVTGRTDCTGVVTQTRDNCIKQQVTALTASMNNPSSIATSYKSWRFPNYADPPTANDAGLACDTIQVTVDYDYHPMTPVFNRILSVIPISASERMVNEPFGPC